MNARFWHGRPTLVTGATGLLGGWLTAKLVELGADVTCIVRDWVPGAKLIRSGLHERVATVRGDIEDASLVERVLAEYSIDTVFHLAAQTIVGIANRNPLSTLRTNIAGTWNVLESARRSPGVRAILLASSDKAYGDQTRLPYDESTPLQGRHPYDVSKSCADLIAQAYAHSYGTPVAITRCGNFYGGGDLNWNRIVPGTIRSALLGEAPVIRSNGSMVRDYFYIEDGVKAYIDLAEALHARPELAGEAFNFSNESQYTVLDVVRRITARIAPGLEPIVRNEASNEIEHQYLSAEKAHRVLGWQPLFDMESGLDRTIDWYRGFLTADRLETIGV